MLRERVKAQFQSTHPLRGATCHLRRRNSLNRFQSTHPLRGATSRRGRNPLGAVYFNPRTPCGVRHKNPSIQERYHRFQSTHPLRGATRLATITIPRISRFQSTHPLRGATILGRFERQQVAISIHAPLAGCDLAFSPPPPMASQISIHAPLAGCDLSRWPRVRVLRISIHAPLAGCDSKNVQRKLHFF